MNEHVLDSSFYGESLSDNISETPEGFLVCHNVKIAKVGTQLYKGSEIGYTEKHNDTIKVHRLPEDVFSDETIRSFEGKVVTEDHPTVYPVTADNALNYIKGHCQNIRRDGEFLIADLVIIDPTLINKIKNKQKRQVSAGYDCEWLEYKNGLRQTNIRANHVAVVDKGRAGPKVSITDSKPVNVKNKSKKGVNPVMDKKKAMALAIAAYAKDAEPDEFSEVIGLLMDSETQATAKKEVKPNNSLASLFKLFAKDADDDEQEPEKKKETAPSLDERMAAMESSISKLTDSFEAFAKKGAADEEHPDKEQDIDELQKILSEAETKAEDEDTESDDDADSEVTDSDDDGDDKDKDALKKSAEDSVRRQIARDMAPLIAQLPKAHRTKIKDSLLGSMRSKAASSNKYLGIKTATKHAKDSKTDGQDLGKAWAKQYNPHYQDAK